MSNHNNRPILSKGEEYIVRHELGKSFPGTDKRPTFDEARAKLSGQVNSIIQNIETSSKEFLLDDVVINLRMRTDYSAKSYHPDDFIGIIDGEDVGSKKWTKTEVNKKGEEKTKIGKEVFIKVKKNSLQALEQKLIHGSGFTKEFIQELKRVTGNYTLEKYYKSLARIARNISPAERKTILNILEIVANQNMGELDTSLLL